MNSGFFKLNWMDYVKGFIVAIVTAILTSILPIIQTGKLPDLATLKAIAISGIAAGIAYLLKNLFTNKEGEIAKKDAV
jgi:ABC-type uncharacterized transport system permease subunit